MRPQTTRCDIPMPNRPPALALLCLAALAAGASLAARGEGSGAQRSPGEQMLPQPGFADPMQQWLDEVKAQRQAWEERRRVAKEAANARRRLADPWGAAQLEAREMESERRRDAIREQADRDHEAFRHQGPWAGQAPWEPGVQSQPTQPKVGEALPMTPESTAQNPSEPAAYPPSGWDNRWYYRGY